MNLLQPVFGLKKSKEKMDTVLCDDNHDDARNFHKHRRTLCVNFQII
jgi:hypothetical protein